MKYFVILFSLLFLVSCGNDSQEIKNKDVGQNIGNKSSELESENQNISVIKKNLLSDKRVLGESYEAMDFVALASLDCENTRKAKSDEVRDVWKLGDNSELKRIIDDIYNSCSEAKNGAKPLVQNLDKKVRGFDINECKNINFDKAKTSAQQSGLSQMQNGFGGINNTNLLLMQYRNGKVSKEKMIEICEFGYAVSKNNCNLFTDSAKQAKCSEIIKGINYFRQIQSYNNTYGNFNVKDFLKSFE